MREVILMDKNRDKEYIQVKMEMFIKVNGWIIK
jgi:hypothetical protein